MRRYCGVRGCGNKTLRSGDSSVSFHHLPKQPDIANYYVTYRRGIYDQMTSEIVDKPILKLDIF